MNTYPTELKNNLVEIINNLKSSISVSSSNLNTLEELLKLITATQEEISNSDGNTDGNTSTSGVSSVVMEALGTIVNSTEITATGTSSTSIPVTPIEPGALVVQKLNRSRVVFFDGWHGAGSAYQRFLELTTWTPGSQQVAIGRQSFASAIATDTAAREYRLLIDGVDFGPIAIAEGETTGEVTVDLSDLPHGWHKLDLGGLLPEESCPTWFACMMRDGLPSPDIMPVSTGSYDFHWDKKNEHAYTWAPAKYEPTAVPLPAHGGPYEHFSHAAKSVRVDLLAPGDGGNVQLPNISKSGIINSFNRQAYFWDDVIRKYPRVALLDGPRGVGTVVMPTHIEIGHAAPPGMGAVNNLYVLDPWRVTKVRDTGEVVTLAGYRHRGMGSYWKDEPGVTLELVGDWSAIPEERHGFHELWGMCWDSTSLITDESAEPIPSERNLKPHLGAGPRMLISDTQNNRICQLQFSNVRHGVPPKVTEFATGLQDAWDIVEDKARDCYYVSERAANRIIALGRDGSVLRTVIGHDPSNPVECYLRPGRRQMGLRGGNAETRLQTARLHPCIGPEGLYLLGDWLYFGSISLEQVRRVNVVTGELEIVCEPTDTLQGYTKFMKIAVSDGTFGPEGTLAVQTWSVHTAHQSLYLPDGTVWHLQQSVPWGGSGYGTAAAIRDGRMVLGTSQYGLRRYSAGPAFDRAKYERGEKVFKDGHWNLLCGTQGFSPYGAALPWGINTDMDYMLEVNGHRRPA